MIKWNRLFFKFYIILSIIFGIAITISLFYSPLMIKFFTICFLWLILGVLIGVIFLTKPQKKGYE